MPRYPLRTLLIALAVLPPAIAGAWWLWKVAGGIILLILAFGAFPIFIHIVPELGPLIGWLLREKPSRRDRHKDSR